VTRELRRLQLDRLVFRADGEDGTTAGSFTGHATAFDVRYPIGDPNSWGFWEQFDTKACDRALDEDQDVRLLVDHDPSRLLARTASKTMTLDADKRGLLVDAELADTSVGRDTAVLLKRGDLSAMSLAFITKKEQWETLDDGTDLRTILDVDLYDVSIVAYPANPETDASIRSALEAAGYPSIRKQRHAEARARFDRLPAQWGRAS
jgi:HK97 family phage prohead protease